MCIACSFQFWCTTTLYSASHIPKYQAATSLGPGFLFDESTQVPLDKGYSGTLVHRYLGTFGLFDQSSWVFLSILQSWPMHNLSTPHSSCLLQFWVCCNWQEGSQVLSSSYITSITWLLEPPLFSFTIQLCLWLRCAFNYQFCCLNVPEYFLDSEVL